MAYDYVIVGAGSAGCVLANRLSEDPTTRVLVLEAGPSDRNLNVKIPAGFANLFHTKRDWDFATEPEPYLDGRSLYMPRGKMLGGSSSMNAMLYVRGRPLDYDAWVEQGAAGWGYNEVLPYFLKAEDNVNGASDFHAVGGPLRVSEQTSPRPATKRLMDAFHAHGVPWSPDYNGPEQDGLAMAQVTQKGGRRWSCADAYLRPAMHRPNVEVRSGVRVRGLELDGTRVTGVRYLARGTETVVRAEAEVILSAGALLSPHLLQLSGIGRPEDLKAAGIPVRHELAGVGHNLHDHPFWIVCWAVNGAGSTLYGADAPKNVAEWMLRRTGPLTSVVAEGFAFIRSRAGLPAADIQFHIAPAYYMEHGAKEYEGDAVGLAPVLITPKSRGWVKPLSADPFANPAIVTNTLEHPDDVRSLIDAMLLARAVGTEGPLAEVIQRELEPGPEYESREDLHHILKQQVDLLYHPVGTCRMSDTHAEAVVDSSCRVHGLEGLRVVDASIFPVIPGGNTNAPTIMVAERAADLIRGRVPAAA